MTIENELSFIVSARRVAKVVEGGRNFNLSIFVVLGNGNGRVGYGLGKASEHTNALEKAKVAARKNLISVDLLSNGTIHHDVTHKFKACKVSILKAKSGHGIIAGNTMRYLFHALGARNIIGKIHGSRNPINIIKCSIEALRSIQSMQHISRKRSVNA